MVRGGTVMVLCRQECGDSGVVMVCWWGERRITWQCKLEGDDGGGSRRDGGPGEDWWLLRTEDKEMRMLIK